MNQITQISDNPNQTLTINLPDGSAMTMQIYYSLTQYGWFILNLAWNDFTLNGIRICNNPNMLRQWENILTWGLACYTSNNREPTQLEDFNSGQSILYILTEAEVQQYSETLSNA